VSDVTNGPTPEIGPPSAFFHEHESRLAASATIGPTLDLACGRGRHALAAADLGLSVVAIDRNPDQLDALTHARAERIETGGGQIEILCADLETPPLPTLEAGSFGAVLVFRYLHRTLFPWIQELIAPGGFVLYETFTQAQKKLGWGPKRDDFLLQSGELRNLFPELVIEVYEEGPSNDERSAHTARLLASRPQATR
jgi:SAM-dependent methyltransferase